MDRGALETKPAETKDTKRRLGRMRCLRRLQEFGRQMWKNSSAVEGDGAVRGGPSAAPDEINFLVRAQLENAALPLPPSPPERSPINRHISLLFLADGRCSLATSGTYTRSPAPFPFGHEWRVDPSPRADQTRKSPHPHSHRTKEPRHQHSKIR